MFIFALAVIAGYVIYAMSPEERAQALRKGLEYLRRTREEVDRRRAEPDPFRDALRERTARPIATALLAGLSVVVFVLMLVGTGSFSDPATLVGWGASLATRTTNGEWWRLLTMTFVHAGLFHLVIEVGALVSVGLVLERLLGPARLWRRVRGGRTPRRARERLGASAGSRVRRVRRDLRCLWAPRLVDDLGIRAAVARYASPGDREDARADRRRVRPLQPRDR